MDHVIAVIALGGACMLWYVVQRITGGAGVDVDTSPRRFGSCGHCTSCDDPATHDPQDCPE
jgi:hypothetical protein